MASCGTLQHRQFSYNPVQVASEVLKNCIIIFGEVSLFVERISDWQSSVVGATVAFLST